MLRLFQWLVFVSGWDMAPYIEAIDSQQSSYFIVSTKLQHHLVMKLLKSSIESTHMILCYSSLVKQVLNV